MAGPVPQLADYKSVADHLVGLKSIGVRFGIERMARFAAALGHPERRFPVIHVAGTNGKGSVAAMLDAIFHESGRSTGLYTSPHLVRLGERVQVNRRILGEDEIVALTAELVPVAERLGAAGADEHPTFFEFMTAMAFLKFARAGVDVGLIETGMGGRLDATNVVLPEVAVITSIGFDHMDFLGDTLAQIAGEKAGIIKAGRPVVIGRLPPEAEAVIRARARDLGAPVHSVRESFGDNTADYPATSLEGDYQRWNAATATLAARVVRERFGLDDATIARGLAHARWPGRWQRSSVGGKAVVLDASHNPEGAAVLSDCLATLVRDTGRKPVVVTGALGEFRARALLETICRHAAAVYLVPPHTERACTHAQLEAAAPAGARHLLHRASLDDIFPAPNHCAVGEPMDTVVVTGSIYLLGEVLARIEPDRGAGEGKLQDF